MELQAGQSRPRSGEADSLRFRTMCRRSPTRAERQATTLSDLADSTPSRLGKSDRAHCPKPAKTMEAPETGAVPLPLSDLPKKRGGTCAKMDGGNGAHRWAGCAEHIHALPCIGNTVCLMTEVGAPSGAHFIPCLRRIPSRTRPPGGAHPDLLAPDDLGLSIPVEVCSAYGLSYVSKPAGRRRNNRGVHLLRPGLPGNDHDHPLQRLRTGRGLQVNRQRS